MNLSYKNIKIKSISDLIDFVLVLPIISYIIVSISLTGQIKPRQELKTFLLSCPSASSEIIEEQLNKWDNFIKTQFSQTIYLEGAKNIFEYKGNEKSLRGALNLACCKQKDKSGRNLKCENQLLIKKHNQLSKTQYNPSWEKIQKLEKAKFELAFIGDSLSIGKTRKRHFKEKVTFLCDCLGMTETQYQRRCRMIEKRMGLN